ncbi:MULTISPECIES: hypothetical protein [unclassified Microbacterium]|uniref:hypothetical protein n=1 Tax=unclassified Microbacterium TaxID=2609290 RepID=UPI00109C299B|nr:MULTISPECIES: hypothetical protein [unclassified Microbacterium]
MTDLEAGRALRSARRSGTYLCPAGIRTGTNGIVAGAFWRRADRIDAGELDYTAVTIEELFGLIDRYRGEDLDAD